MQYAMISMIGKWTKYAPYLDVVVVANTTMHNGI